MTDAAREGTWSLRLRSGRLNAVLPILGLLGVIPPMVLVAANPPAVSPAGVLALIAWIALVGILVLWATRVAVVVTLDEEREVLRWRPMVGRWTEIASDSIVAIDRGRGRPIAWLYPAWARIRSASATVFLIDADCEGFDRFAAELQALAPNVVLDLRAPRPAYRNLSRTVLERRG